MIHLPHLITDLGFILMIAALATLLFKKLGQPQVLGYLIAGFLVGPHVPFMPTVSDTANITLWSEIGVIFLLFSLGLEFSFKKLFKVGGSAGFTAVFEVIFMMGLGYSFGRIMGWNNIDSLFFGGILSVSSTTIIVRAFEELGLKGQKFTDFVFGILVVEDIVAILLLVLLGAMAASGSFSGADLAMSGLRLTFFMALWFVVGIFLIPIFLRKIRPLLEDESLLLVAIGLCFLMVMIATKVGFSPALGAFVMGSLLAETPEGHHMEEVLKPVKNLFAAIFFVSVGMMIDPKILVGQWQLVILVTLLTILGKFVSTFLGAILSGQTRKKSFQAGMSLAQIGEFSFIIASLGVTLKVTSDFLYPLAIAVSVVTTFTTPYMIKSTNLVYEFVERKLPVGFKALLDRYHASINREGEVSAGALIMKAYGVKILLNSILIVALMGVYQTFLKTQAYKYTEAHPWAGTLALFTYLVLSAPFFWGLLMSGPSSKVQRQMGELKKLRYLQVGVVVGRFTLAIVLFGIMIAQFMTLKMATGVMIAVIAVAALAGQFWVRNMYQSIEKNFVKNLTEKEKQALVSEEIAKNFLPWDATLGRYEVPLECELAGMNLRSISFKEKFGINVAAVYRGSKRYFAPDGEFVLWPYDKIICFGAEEDLQGFQGYLEAARLKQQAAAISVNDEDTTDYRLRSFVVETDSDCKDKTIRDSGIREAYHGMVVGVERGTERILGPRASFTLLESDLVWIVSDNKKREEAPA